MALLVNGFGSAGTPTANQPLIQISNSRAGPILAAAAVITYAVLGALSAVLGRPGVTALQYVVIGVLGAWFLYYGLKAVQLTEMSNKVWKRAVEYNLILEERKRLRVAS